MKRKPPTERKPSSLEAAFELLWSKTAAACPLIATLEKEVKLPPRQYRYDFRIPHTNILIEIMGGTYAKIRMGHSSGDGLHRDYAKSRFAQMKGFLVLAYDRKQINVENIEELFVHVIRTYPHLADKQLPSD